MNESANPKETIPASVGTSELRDFWKAVYVAAIARPDAERGDALLAANAAVNDLKARWL